MAVARAIVTEPKILLADEPTANLDSANGDMIMEMLSDLHKTGSTICMVTHDPRYAGHAQRTVHLFDGRIVEDEKKVPDETSVLDKKSIHEKNMAVN